MDQKKIGQFLKRCRQDYHLTQEQLAQKLGVTNRSISRWENGVNMPDFDLVMEITDIFHISIEEFLDGERKQAYMNEEEKAVILKVADYQEKDKMRTTKILHRLFWVAVIAFGVYMYLDVHQLTESGVYEKVASGALGFVLGTLLVGVLYTSRYLEKVKSFKKHLLKK